MRHIEIITDKALESLSTVPHVALVDDNKLAYNGCGGIVVDDITDFSATAKYVFKSEISKSEITFGDGSIIVFDGDGKLMGASISGNNLQVVNANFRECSFDNATFVKSRVKASQFGCIGDMESEEQGDTTIKGTPILNLVVNNGTDNKDALKSLASFLSGSDRIDVEFDGAFFDARNKGVAPYVTINGASNISVHGGVLITGLRFRNCTNVEVYEMEFVGYHQAHSFPPGRTASSIGTITLNGKEYTNDNTYNYGADGTEIVGLAAEGVVVYSEEGFTSTGAYIHDCLFEMRLNGVVLNFKRGTITDYLNAGYVSGARVSGNNFSHIYFQPIGCHAENVYIHDNSGEYFLQALDISTMSHNVRVENCEFTDAVIGPKQESFKDAVDGYNYTYGNSIVNSSFTITDRWLFVDTEPYLLNIAQGKKDSEFVMKNCYMKIFSRRYASSLIRCCNYSQIFDGCVFTVRLKTQAEKSYGAMRLFFSQGDLTTSYNSTANVTLNDCVISVTDCYYCVAEGSAKMSFSARNSSFEGDLRGVFAYPLTKMSVDKCEVSVECSSFAESCKDITIKDSDFSKMSSSRFIVTSSAESGYSIVVSDSVFPDTVANITSTTIAGITISDCKTESGVIYNSQGKIEQKI